MIDKILSKFREIGNIQFSSFSKPLIAVEDAIKIVQEVAKEYEDKANEAREDFMEIVYAELDEDADNNRANRIIEAFDTYAPHQKGEPHE